MAPKQKRLDLAFFIPISKVERKKNAERDFANLHERLENERANAKEEITKRPVGRPKKEKVAELLHPIAVPMKLVPKRLEVTTKIGSLLNFGLLSLLLLNNTAIFKRLWIS
jgi:hypothetical protein